ncbi:MAG: sulfotransferase [Planctomycetota bacterium]
MPSKIVYIAGYGRSGSTVLDMTLGQQPNALGLSEITHVFHYWLDNKACSCGQAIRECEFWRPIFDQLGFHDDFVSKAAKATALIESRPLWWSRLFHAKHRRVYRDAWQPLIKLVASTTGSKMLIDSSKTTRRATFRAAALSRICDQPVYVVHLVRNPDAVAWSFLRGDNTKLEDGVVKVKRGGKLRVAITWMLANLWVHLLYASRNNYQLVKYETFASEPETTARNISNQIVVPEVPGDCEESPIPPLAWNHDHGIAGNRARRSASKKIVVDKEWKQGQSNSSGWIGWPLRKWYGY